MSELTRHPASPDEPRETATQAALAEDLGALRTVTAHDRPSLGEAVSNARRRHAPDPWEERLMSTLRTIKYRPWLATAVAAALVVTLGLLVPVSYERTAGHDVTLTVAGPHLGSAEIGAIARQLKAALGAEHVLVQSREGAQAGVVMQASIPSPAGNGAAAIAQAFARGLVARGYTATANTAARKERVSGSVYAYALQRVIEIRTDGKSAAELETEIRQRFAEAGIPEANVSVTDNATGGRKIAIEVKHASDGSGNATPTEAPELVLTKDGVPIGQNGFTVKVQKRKNESGTVLVVEVRDAGRTGHAEVSGADAMTDAALAAAVQSQLRAAGLAVHVTVTDGRVAVERDKPE